MKSYIRYKMTGFNKKIPRSDKWEITLTDNKEHIYDNHPFLYSVYIDDHITNITFKLKDGLSCEQYKHELHQELEELTFKIIAGCEGLPINMPVCQMEEAVDYNGNDCIAKLKDHMSLGDALFLYDAPMEANNIYKLDTEIKTAYKEKEAAYKELFFILHSPHKIVQFLGLYDLMADLICSKYSKEIRDSQSRVTNFFGKYKDHYNLGKNDFKKSLKNEDKSEDKFTHLRNKIAHSKQAGIEEYLKAAQSIPFSYIQTMLIVINDLICGEVEP